MSSCTVCLYLITSESQPVMSLLEECYINTVTYFAYLRQCFREVSFTFIWEDVVYGVVDSYCVKLTGGSYWWGSKAIEISGRVTETHPCIMQYSLTALHAS